MAVSDTELKLLREDYARVTGKETPYFFCPILHKDEDTELCDGHVVNKAFKGLNTTVLQRKDVDGFYGSFFEADYILLADREEPLKKAWQNPLKWGRLNPQVYADGEKIDSYPLKGDLPSHFTKIDVEMNQISNTFGLKISPEQMQNLVNARWEIRAEVDIRLKTVVSLIKAAHLTAFKLMGYWYALSAGGTHVGNEILGKFYLRLKDKKKLEIEIEAKSFFKEFQHMVRPLQNITSFEGTIKDSRFFVCEGNNRNLWGLIVFVPTPNMMHSVLLPVLGNDECASLYYSFLDNNSEHLEVRECIFQKEKSSWLMSKEKYQLRWPKTGIFLD